MVPATLLVVVLARNAIAAWNLRLARRVIAALVRRQGGIASWGAWLHVGPRYVGTLAGSALTLELRHRAHGLPLLVAGLDVGQGGGSVPELPPHAICALRGGRAIYREPVAARQVDEPWLRARLELLATLVTTAGAGTVG